jgi:hypothetical protein
MDPRETGWTDMDWINLAQDRDKWKGPFERSTKLSGSIKCWEILEELHNWRLLKNGSVPRSYICNSIINLKFIFLYTVILTRKANTSRAKNVYPCLWAMHNELFRIRQKVDCSLYACLDERNWILTQEASKLYLTRIIFNVLDYRHSVSMRDGGQNFILHATQTFLISVQV